MQSSYVMTFHPTNLHILNQTQLSMGKYFKLRIFRAIPFFHSCHSQPSSCIVPQTIKAKPLPLPSPAPPSKQRRVSSTVSIGCGFRSKTNTRPAPEHKRKLSTSQVHTTTPPHWTIYNSSVSFDRISPSPQVKPKQNTPFSTSSPDNSLFSSEDEENQTFFSSVQTFSTDSSFSESGTNLGAITEKPVKKKKKRIRKVVKCYGSKNKKMTYPSPESEEEEDSFAVVKKTEDAYGDFRRSMMEMILEKQMFDAKDLEILLQCFLSLNSKQHYGVIVEAFSDIWEILFCKSPRN